MLPSLDSFSCRNSLKAAGRSYEIFSLEKLRKSGPNPSQLPFSLKILLENLLRNEDGRFVQADDIHALTTQAPGDASEKEIAFTPARVLMQDFTGVPAIVDLAAMREAMKRMGGDPARINPLVPVDLVIDHSVQADRFGTADAFTVNTRIEIERNHERYAFLRWGQKAFRNFRVVPPGTGIVHQVNLEYLATVVMTASMNGKTVAYSDTLVGTDSHTTMINGLGVLGWGVGGIEAEAAMLGQPISMLIPDVVGFKLTGRLPEGATATDVVLTVTEMLRQKGVVGKFVEFFGPGLDGLSLADRATIANMAPEYGATMGFFPVDQQTLDYLEMTGRPAELIQLVEAYTKTQGIFRTNAMTDPQFSDIVTLDLAAVEPCLAGPKRPQDRVPLKEVKANWQKALTSFLESRVKANDMERIQNMVSEGAGAVPRRSVQATTPVAVGEAASGDLDHGAVVIAAITSCTNTSNPTVMIGAGLLAKKAVERGLSVKPWVKTSLAPGSKVVVDYLKAAGLLPYLERLGFYLVGFGCTTCIGNSGPLPETVAETVQKKDLVVAAVLSGNRNFEGRIHPLVRANYLASPPLVVAYALAGRIEADLRQEPLGHDPHGQPVYLRDVWPSPEEIQKEIHQHLRKEMFAQSYTNVFEGDDAWKRLNAPGTDLFAWHPESTYVKNPPYFDEMPRQAPPLQDIRGARVLVMVGDSVTTDHISPAGSISENSPAGKYLIEHGVDLKDFNSYGSRRGNHEIMMRGTFANIRLRNLLAPGTEGGITLHLPDKQQTTVYEAARRYKEEKVPLVVLAGKEYGAGSSRDWAAKGPALLGVKAVVAESYERIHRSNLVGLGVLPLEFMPGQNRQALGLTGWEIVDVPDLDKLKPKGPMTVIARSEGVPKKFQALARIDTPEELEYFRQGGILPHVLRQLLNLNS